MRGHRSWLVVALAVAGGISGCSSPTSTATGVLTGKTRACTLYEYRQGVDLRVYRGNVVVTSQHVPANSTYRFVLPAGRYFISTGGPLQSAHPVVLNARSTVHMDIPSFMCF
jgi:hypothetical protein